MRRLSVAEPLLLYGAAVCWAYGLGGQHQWHPVWATAVGQTMLMLGLVVYFIRRRA